MSLQSLGVLELRRVLTRCNAATGAKGFDPARDPRTSTKPALLQYLAQTFPDSVVIDAVKAEKAGEQQGKQPGIANAIPENDGPEIAPIANADDAATLAAIISRMAGAKAAPIDEAKVREIVGQAIDTLVDAKIQAAKLTPSIIEIRSPDRPPIALEERTNPAFQEAVSVASEYPNIMLVGPAGTGKTHMAAQIARALGKSFASISGSPGVTESHLTGRLLPTGENGRFEYTPSPFVSEYSKDDGCFLVDEFDALDPSAILVANGATANGGFFVESRKAAGLDPYVKRGKGSLLIASMNTYGTGADAVYCGRAPQDGAALDRWYFIPVDYDIELEATLAPAEICEWVWGIRKAVAQHKLRRVVSTRMVQKAAAAKRAGQDMRVIKSRLLAGWTKDELQKVGE